MNKLISLTSLSIACLSFFSCNVNPDDDNFIVKTGMAYVIATDNQGQGVITTYEPTSMTVTQNAYYAANKTNIGENPISINFSNKIGYITVGNELNVVNPLDLKSTGKIAGLESPSYSAFLGLDKAMVANYKNNHISVINPADRSVKGKIILPENTFAQNPVQWNNKVYFNTNSAAKSSIIEITSEENKEGVIEDKITRELNIKPNSNGLSIDRMGRLWTMSIGDNDNISAPVIQLIDPVGLKVISELELTNTSPYKPRMAMINGTTEMYYIASGNVFKAQISGTVIESTQFIALENLEPTALAIDPVAQTVYVGYKVDQNTSKVVRFDRNGKINESFETAANINNIGFYTIY